MQLQANVLELPSRRFQPRIYGLGAWTDNLHFAYDLVAATKPRVLVELGTDRGESYFAFCQSIAENQTGTRSFAIDTWRGDEHAGAYDETTFREVSQHNRAHYSAFSTLLRSSFDDARDNFAPASIDLLHLDGLHTEAAVRHDLEAWLPKLAPGGILLLHDVAMRTRDFGVWKLWEELCARGRSYMFSNGPGLGVWQKPPVVSPPSLVESLLSGPPDSLAEYYRERAQDVQTMIARAWRDGTIRQTALARQTFIQVFHSHDGVHSEENSVLARVGHEAWKDISLPLPLGAGAAPLRIDFLSALTVIDLDAIRLASETETWFAADEAAGFDRITVAGDAERCPHPKWLRLKITGIDPQLYLPVLSLPSDACRLTLTLRLRVSGHEAPAD